MHTFDRRRCQCGRDATIYAVDHNSSGWGAYFCLNCLPNAWQITGYVYPYGW